MERRTHCPLRASGSGAARAFARAALWVLLLAASSPARGSIPPEIPMVQRIGSGVAALGMGGAAAAVADDYTALAANPAGLAQLRSTEFGGGFHSRSHEISATYLGAEEATSLDKSRIHAAGFAYPFPTWRGSFVIGFAYDREADFDQDYFRAGAGPGVAFEEERIFEDGSLGAWRAGFGVSVTPALMLGVGATLLTGESRRERDFQFEQAGGADWELTSTVDDIDFTAVSATLGALYRGRNGLRAGFALHLPETYDLDGRRIEDVRRFQVAGDTLDYYDDFTFEDEISLPFRSSLGLSYELPGALDGLLLAFQWDYADWQQIDYAGPIRFDNREYAYRPTHDFRFGVRYTARDLPLPVQLRAGFISQPVAYRVIATDVFRGEATEARFDPDRRYFTAGLGLELDPALTLDATYLQGKFTRTGSTGTTPGAAISTTTESYDDRRVLLGATFRLPPAF